ncbi:hypothetical protein [Haploplasma axanthum]|nr:hypothetical protein [Haploplasma axanthum]
MEKFSLLQYTKKIIEKLDNENLYITHINIAYKFISYYENNIGNIDSITEEHFDNMISAVYERYIESDSADILDEIIENILNEDSLV